MLLRRSGVLPLDALWVSSPEPKAASTARLLTSSGLRLDDDLREARRDGAFVAAAAFQERVLASFADPGRPAAPGWEPLCATRLRMLRAAERAVARAAGRDVVLVGHGTGLTLLLSGVIGEDPDVAAWTSMRFPDHCAVSSAGELVSPWGAWTP